MSVRPEQHPGGRPGLPMAVLLAISAMVLVFLAARATPALAVSAGPAWAIQSAADPTNFSKEDTEDCTENETCDAYVVNVANVGDMPSSGTVVVRDRLPQGVVVDAVPNATLQFGGVQPTSAGGRVNCLASAGAAAFSCEYFGGAVPPGGVISIGIEVTLTPVVGSSVTNVAEVEGGGAPPAVTGKPSTVPNTVNGPPPLFGIQGFGVGMFGFGGLPDVQADGHPVTSATTIGYSTAIHPLEATGSTNSYTAVQEPKMQIVDLPPGLVGDPLSVGQCPEFALYEIDERPQQCPADSQVGLVVLNGGGTGPAAESLYNVPPEAGYPAEFGFEFDGTLVYLRARVLPTAGGYAVSLSVPDVPRSFSAKILGATVTFFGDPSEQDGGGSGEAFLTNPDACGAGSLNADLEMDSWVQPGRWVDAQTPAYAGLGQGVTGCEALVFEPSVEVMPEQSTVDTPSGYEVDVKIPQARDVPGLLATPDLKNVVVSLPEGVAVSPGAADGLVACQASGPEGIELGSQDKLSDENVVQEGEEIGPDGLVHPARGHCPVASQVGTVEALTPIQAKPLQGRVYLAQPQCGGEGQPGCTEASAVDGELFGLYFEVEGSGVVIKERGAVSVNPKTGQLTTRVQNFPQQPVSELKLRLKGGARAPLANPQSCGRATTATDMTPWSAPATPDATPFSSFTVGGCAGSTPFAPAFTAGTVSSLAGAFSPFTLTLSRHDGEQDLSGITVSMPSGLLGSIAGIPLCGEAQASAGSCPAASAIGSASAAAGAGSHPFWQAGTVYLTGAYKGGPFGLSIVVPAKAGPFNLGNIVVRAAIHIDPQTAALTVVSDPLPQMVDGVPLRVQSVDVNIDRPGFIFNPTNCSGQQVGGTISSAQGASVAVSTPFAAEGCKGLAFKPSFVASTRSKSSKQNGASLRVDVTPVAGQAHIAKVAVTLPRTLPSRLTTIQKACVAAVFEANPASCPAASVIGTAVVRSPVLNSPVAGPIYLVSHGGEAFPNVELVLQGEGVTLVQDAQVAIKKGITSATFNTVPDAPIRSIETVFPEGPHSALGAVLPASAKGSLCGQTLSMPTTLTGQNGAVVQQNTRIAVTGCPKAAVKKKTKAKKATAVGSPGVGRGKGRRS